jgi:hypothetical protein
VTAEQFTQHVDQCHSCSQAKSLSPMGPIKPSMLLCEIGREFLEGLTAAYRRVRHQRGLRRPDGPSIRDVSP